MPNPNPSKDTRFKPGQSGNPKGRPVGSRDYRDIYRDALTKIAETNDMSPEELETILEETGLKKALKGDFKFWQDIRDRIHGKPKQAVEIGGELPNTLIELMVHASQNGSDKGVSEKDSG